MKKLILVLSIVLCGFNIVWGSTSEYCNHSTSDYPAVTWETDGSGNVVITISDSETRKNVTFRNGAFEGNMNGFTVLSGSEFATSESASNYFTRSWTEGANVFYLNKKSDVTLPNPCKIKFTSSAMAWKEDGNGNAYCFPTFVYTYGTLCNEFLAPTDVSVSSKGRITFTATPYEYDLDEDTYEARIYKAGVLVQTQEVENNDVLNFVSMEAATVQVKVVAISGKYSSAESDAYNWSVEAGQVFGKSNYCEELFMANNDPATAANITWETNPQNGVITIKVTSAQVGVEDDQVYFKETAMDYVKFTYNGSPMTDYFTKGWTDNVNQSSITWIPRTDAGHIPQVGASISFNNGKTVYQYGSGYTYPNLTFTNYLYGTKCSSADGVNPVIFSFTLVESTTTTATFAIEASDVDDDDVPQPLTYTITGDNGFTETVVTPNAQGQFTLSNLKQNSVYNFTMTVTDPSYNATSSNPLSVRVTFDPTYNLTLNKPSEAGIHQDANVASQANDGNENNFWTCYDRGTSGQWWWVVDMQALFNVNRVRILFNDHQGTYNLSTSADGEQWNLFAADFTIDEAHKDYTINDIVSTRYFKFTSSDSRVGIKEFEAYGTSFAESDQTAPELSLSEVSKTINSVVLGVVAADKDDLGGTGTITSIKISDVDNGLAEAEYLSSWSSNQITLSDLKYNTTYNFKVVVTDAAGNSTEKSISVVLPFNTDLNLALNKSSEANIWQGANVASRGNDGNEATIWTSYGETSVSEWWWKVDLGASYNINRVRILFNDHQGTYTLYTSLDGETWNGYSTSFTIDNDHVDYQINAVASTRYIKFTSTAANVGIKEFEVYGTAFAVVDHTAPELTLSEVSKTINSVVLGVVATDKDDLGGTGTITSIKISDVDNGLDEAEYLSSWSSNQITLSDLKYNTTYNFKVVVTDAAGNSTEKSISVVLPFNTDLNLALNKPCTGGHCQFGNQTPEGKAAQYKLANDGNLTTSYSAYGAPSTDDAWWQVDLGAIYKLSRVDVTWANNYSTGYTIYGSFDGLEWFVITTDAASAEGKVSTNTTAATRYIKIHSYDIANIVFKEVEVYATGFASKDTTDPVISSFTQQSVTTTSATLKVIASDVNDNEEPQEVVYTLSANHDFITTEVLPSDAGEFTVSDLHPNYTYTFTITVTDKAGNYATQNLDVTLTWDANYNLALDGTATAGFAEKEEYAAEKANDGNNTTKWNSYGVDLSVGKYANNWWQVEMDNTYTITRIVANYEDATNNTFVFEGSLDGSNWYLLYSGKNTTNGSHEYVVSAPARYVRYSCSDRYNVVYEFEVYGSGVASISDAAPVITYAVTDEIEATYVTIKVDAVDISTMPITSYYVTGAGEPQMLTAVDGIITLSAEPNTNYTVSIQAVDGDNNYSDAKELAFKTPGTITGLYLYSGHFGWNKTHEQARFSTTPVSGVAKLDVTFENAENVNYKLYNATDDRCTKNDCGGATDHYVVATANSTISFYATSEDQFVSTADNLYLSGTLFAKDQALTWNSEHTQATWTGSLDLLGTKTFTIKKNNGAGWVYTQDIYSEDQVYTGDLVKAQFTFDVTTMTGTWTPPMVTIDETIDNTSTISDNDGLLVDVTLNRTFVADGYWYTLCLPFSLTAEQLAAAYGADYDLRYLSSSYMKSSDEMYLNFVKTTELEAGMPYMFKPTGSSNEEYTAQTFTGVVIDNKTPVQTTSYATMTGFYAPMAIAETDYALGSDDYLYHTDGTASKALRCYFTLNPPTAAPLRARCVFNESQVITNLKNVNVNENANRKMIIDGKLIIVRDGKMFNAQGVRL